MMDFDEVIMFAIDKIFSVEMLTGIQFAAGGFFLFLGSVYFIPGIMFGAMAFFLSGALTFGFSLALKKIIDYDPADPIEQVRAKRSIQKDSPPIPKLEPSLKRPEVSYVSNSPNNVRTFSKI